MREKKGGGGGGVQEKWRHEKKTQTRKIKRGELIFLKERQRECVCVFMRALCETITNL